MKMKKCLRLLLLLPLLQSCTKDFDEVNTNPSQFLSPAPEAIFTGVLKGSVDQMVSNNMLYFWSYAHHISIQGGASRYSSGNDATWDNSYRYLSNLNQLKVLYANKPGYSNRIHIANIWECYIYAYLVGIYGPIPYSQALKTDSSAIRFDAENDVYTSLFQRLKTSSDSINLSGDKFAPDPLMGGDLTKWKKFANALRLRLALRCRLNLPVLSETVIREVMANENNLLTSASDNIKFSYGTGDVNESPYYTRLLRNAVVVDQLPKASSYLFTNFRSFKDPRLAAYFEPVPPANQVTITDTLSSSMDDTLRVVQYKIPYYGIDKSPQVLASWGLPPAPLGSVATEAASSVKSFILAADHPFMIMDFAEICFLKAEAAFLGFGGSKTALAYYTEGITANFNTWGVGSALAAYLTQNGVKWDTQGNGFYLYTGLVKTDIPLDNLSKIWVQRYINYYPDGAFDSYCLQRRTRSLDLPPHTNVNNQYLSADVSDFPDRWEYRPNQFTLNLVGTQDGVAKLGGPNLPNVLLKIAKPFTRKEWRTAKAFYDTQALQKWYGTTVQSLQAAGIPYTIINKFR